MFIRLMRILFLLGVLFTVMYAFSSDVVAAGTTSIHIVKYDADGVTILDEVTIDYTDMEDLLPIQGNGNTHYFHQGPTFDTANLWDPDETVNLKDKGALKGTDLKDLCELVGGMSEGDAVRVTASDGFNKTFEYGNVYNPAPRQGRIVINWYCDGYGYVSEWNDGMMLVCFAQTTNAAGQYVFGNWDMHETFPEYKWHYYDIYPSSNGYTIKNINRISIYSGGVEESGEGNYAVINVTANVVLSTVGISLSRSEIDYEDLEPGENSAIVDVGITNTGTKDVYVTLEVLGDGDIAQDFYEQSLYIDDVIYDSSRTIATVNKSQTETVDTQLKVPDDWDEGGRQNALFTFWAEAID